MIMIDLNIAFFPAADGSGVVVVPGRSAPVAC